MANRAVETLSDWELRFRLLVLVSMSVEARKRGVVNGWLEEAWPLTVAEAERRWPTEVTRHGE